MNVLVYLLPMALGLGLIGLGCFLWTLRTGQYDDLDGCALRILTDDDMRQDAQANDTSLGLGVHPRMIARGTSVGIQGRNRPIAMS
jgi:cbb3-type cytochrome oxidase maturation protein